MVVIGDTPLGAEQGWELLGQEVGSEQGEQDRRQEQLWLPWQHPAHLYLVFQSHLKSFSSLEVSKDSGSCPLPWQDVLSNSNHSLNLSFHCSMKISEH